MDVASQLESLRTTLSLVLTRMDALETRIGQGDRMPEQNNLGATTDDAADRREQLSDPVSQTGRDGKVLPKLISNQKEKLSAIPELNKPEEWPRFLSQLMIIMDGIYPFVADWMQRVQQLSDRPSSPVLHRICMAMQLQRDQQELYEQFTIDLWVILTLKVQGESRSIITLIHTELKTSEQRTIRGPAAFHELYREHHGRFVDQQILLIRQVNSPERARSLAEVGDYIRRWESRLAEWELVNETRMNDIQRAGSMMALLPVSFENQVAQQPGYLHRKLSN